VSPSDVSFAGPGKTDAELARAGRSVDNSVCEHFAYSRQELFQIVKIGRIESFEALLAGHGRGNGCEVGRPRGGRRLLLAAPRRHRLRGEAGARPADRRLRGLCHEARRPPPRPHDQASTRVRRAQSALKVGDREKEEGEPGETAQASPRLR